MEVVCVITYGLTHLLIGHKHLRMNKRWGKKQYIFTYVQLNPVFLKLQIKHSSNDQIHVENQMYFSHSLIMGRHNLFSICHYEMHIAHP